MKAMVSSRDRRGLREIADVIPTNWVDPLLTGPAAVISNQPYTCKDIERLLLAVRVRVLDKLKALEQQDSQRRIAKRARYVQKRAVHRRSTPGETP